jgi:hypothetical protein
MDEKDELMKEMEDINSMISYLEEEYRKANISEKSYQEMKEKYSKRLEELKKKIGSEKKSENKKSNIVEKVLEKKEEWEKGGKEEKKKDEANVDEIKEMTPEVIEKLAQQVAQQAGVTESVVKEEAEEEKVEAPAATSIEIEKLKVMIDTVREANKAIEEKIMGISENIGELRSMIFQMEGSNREISLKLEKIEDEIAEIKPKEIEKKFNELRTKMEKQSMAIEKLEAISKDLASKINEASKMLKIIDVENLAEINKDIKKKIEEMKEALSYTERLASKTEKVFVDLSKSLSDFNVYKARQENLEDMVKDTLKIVDEVNLKLEGFSTKKDLELIKGDIVVIQKQIEEINKVLAAVQTKIPEPIAELKKEKEDIMLFLDSLEEQLKKGTISIGEYEMVKKENLKKLKDIEEELKEKWNKIIEAISKGETIEVEETKKAEASKSEKAEESKKEKEIPEQKKKEMIDIISELEEKLKYEEEKSKRKEMIDIINKIKEKLK